MEISDCVLIEPFTCLTDDNMFEVAKKLRGITLRHIFVVDKNKYPVGIISLVDVNNRLVAKGLNPISTYAEDIMSNPIDVINVSDDVKEVCISMINKNKVMNAVVKDGVMVGTITITQLLEKSNKVYKNEKK